VNQQLTSDSFIASSVCNLPIITSVVQNHGSHML